MRLLLDEHHDPSVARRLRERGEDVVAVAEREDLRGRADADVFAAAGAEGRAIVTENVRDFAALARRAGELGESHPGVILTAASRFPRTAHARRRLVDALARLLEGHAQADGLRDTVVWL